MQLDDRNDRVTRVRRQLQDDIDRLHDIMQLPAAFRARYATGINKLRTRIYQERTALGLAPDDTEAWRYWLLDDFDYEQHPPSVRDTINRHLARVERLREKCDLDGMLAEQRWLEEYVRALMRPKQLTFRSLKVKDMQETIHFLARGGG